MATGWNVVGMGARLALGCFGARFVSRAYGLGQEGNLGDPGPTVWRKRATFVIPDRDPVQEGVVGDPACFALVQEGALGDPALKCADFIDQVARPLRGARGRIW